MIHIQLQQFLPAQISDEAAFQLVQVVKGLAIALEANYFEQMLHHTGTCEYAKFSNKEEEENEQPF
jgi:hypothetical protein